MYNFVIENNRFMNEQKAKERDFRKVEAKVRKAIREYGLIEDGDRILIGLSGGKDSLALVDFLRRQSKVYKPKFELVVAHVIMTNIPYHSDLEYLKTFAEEYSLPFIVYETSFDLSTDRRKSPCFLCSWMRRKTLFDIAKSEKCNKIALGHHQDDILETLLMNMTHQGSFGTMPPKLKMDKFDMTIIRPMCLVAEKELIQIASSQKYRRQIKGCPYESSSSRSDMKDILAKLEAINPEARYSIWSSMATIRKAYLPQKVDKKEFYQSGRR